MMEPRTIEELNQELTDLKLAHACQTDELLRVTAEKEDFRIRFTTLQLQHGEVLREREHLRAEINRLRITP